MHLSENTKSNRPLWRNKERVLLANPPLQARVKGNHQLNHGRPGQRHSIKPQPTCESFMSRPSLSLRPKVYSIKWLSNIFLEGMYIFPYKSIRKQIWPAVKKIKVNQGHYLNKLCRAHVPSAATKPQGHWPFGSGEDFSRVFTIYEHCSHLGHVTQTPTPPPQPRTNFCSPDPWRLHMKFGFDWLNCFGEEDVWKWWMMTTDGWQSLPIL